MSVQTTKELLFDAVKWDEHFLAHAVYYAVQQGLVGLEEPSDRIPFERLDYETVKKMRDDNTLSMCKIKLYTIPMGAGRFAFYLAENQDDASFKHREIYGKPSQKVNDMTDKMDTSLYCKDTSQLQSFREIKQQVIDFPYFTGELQK